VALTSSSAKKTFFAAVAAFLESAKRQLHATTCAKGIDIHLPCFDGLGNTLLASTVFCPHSRHQSVVGAIGQGNRLGLGFKRHGCQHRPKNFFLRTAMVGGHMTQECGCDVIAFIGQACSQHTLRHDINARLFRLTEVVRNPVALRHVHQGPQSKSISGVPTLICENF